MPHNNEASVEEILESIKKVIARDNREIPPAVQIPDEGGAIANEDDDVLDLGEMEVAEENDSSEAPLTTDEVQKSMRENFEALAMLAEPGARPQIVRSGETSLEGLVREMLRPMLAEWLDTNLPGMVEK
ncbi:MAG: DUF2497 domain-containing protein, partial [Altererythrobacter ishigakiensis]|nr:DUF2497 domain-containing protein [Altererythrobacter ishigakiensis]